MSETTFGDFVLGLAGLGLLRSWYASEAPERRRRLIELASGYHRDEILRLPLPTPEFDPIEGYGHWAAGYDAPGNPLVELDHEVLVPMFAARHQPGRVALDVGCGTGRLTEALVEIGYDAVGVDLSPAMLAVARAKLPTGDLREGSFDDLPVESASVDLVVSGLAACHAVDLGPVFGEMARVLRPGGQVIVSGPHPHTAFAGGQAFFPHEDGMPFVRNHAHLVGEYVDAILGAGMRLDGVRDVPYSEAAIAGNPVANIWPDVAEAAFAGMPFLIVFEATLTES